MQYEELPWLVPKAASEQRFSWTGWSVSERREHRGLASTLIELEDAASTTR